MNQTPRCGNSQAPFSLVNQSFLIKVVLIFSFVIDPYCFRWYDLKNVNTGLIGIAIAQAPIKIFNIEWKRIMIISINDLITKDTYTMTPSSSISSHFQKHRKLCISLIIINVVIWNHLVQWWRWTPQTSSSFSAHTFSDGTDRISSNECHPFVFKALCFFVVAQNMKQVSNASICTYIYLIW